MTPFTHNKFDPNGLYSDHRRLATGGRGETWFAKDTMTGKPVVLKIRQASEKEEAQASLEARQISRVHHPAIQQFHKLTRQDDLLIVEYGFVDGESLRDRLDRTGTLSAWDSVDVARGILDGLTALHAMDIAHRDISPENVILRNGNLTDPVLIDFDALGHLNESSAMGQTTIVGNFAGKLLYMAPEQLAGAPQSAATDIWVLGEMLYEMLVGRPLRRGMDFAQIIKTALETPDLSALSAFPNDLHNFVALMLEVDPVKRASAKQLLVLAAELGGKQILDAPFADENGPPPLSSPDAPSAPLIPNDWTDPFDHPDSTPPAPQEVIPEHWDKPAPAPAAARDAAGDDPFGSAKAPAAAETPLHQKKSSPLKLALFAALLLCAVIFGALAYYTGLFGADHPPVQIAEPDTITTSSPTTVRPIIVPNANLLEFVAPTLLIGAGVLIACLGYVWLRTQNRQPVRRTLTKTLHDLIGGDGEDVRKMLMRTVMINLEPEVARGGAAPFQIAALAQEYLDAKDSGSRLEALKTLIEVHHRVSGNARSIWKDPERLIARALSLTALAGGVIAAVEGVRRLI